MKFHLFWLCCCFFCFALFDAQAQTDGLAFHSHEVIQDNRTGLSFGEDKPLCIAGGMELSFEISFLPQQTNYFGYIVRLLNNQDKNIDILYDYDPKFGDKHFRVITGDTYSRISFNIPGIGTDESWHTIRIKLDPANNQLAIARDAEVFDEKIQLPEKNCYSIFFGANDYKTFKNADVPPIKIRNVIIKENNKVRYNWPLNELQGSSAAEISGRQPGKVSNPIWIAKMHRNWQPLQQLTLKGPASVAFDKAGGMLYLLTRDSLFSYNLAANKISAAAYETGEQLIYSSYQSVYYPASKQIFVFSKDLKRLAALSLATLQWDKQLEAPERSSGYGHFNKCFLNDSLLYTFNGYGFFLYKNDVFSSTLPENGIIDSTTSNITPRYLAAAGAGKKGVYILGGYGNASGKQVLNPKNLYDLNYFDKRTGSWKKIYELKPEGEEFVFANSLVINEKDKTWYGLTFPKHKFNSALQLVKGSLQHPEFTMLGDKIPYQFQDIDSYADLYYSEILHRFLAVTLYSPGTHNYTTVKLFTIYDPPFSEKTVVVPVRLVDKRLLSAIGILTILMVAGLMVSKRPALSADPVINDPLIAAETPQKNCIYLFGDFEVIDAQGENITRLFTPLLRELCLLILLHSIKWERGINAEKLKELLWFDKSPDSARNNLAVNIAKLKGLLDKIEGCELSKETGNWKINIGEQLYVDYAVYLAAIQSQVPVSTQQVINQVGILQRGSFLPGDEYDWLDPFKSEISNEVIDYFLPYARQADLRENATLIIKLADCLYVFDPVNEELLRLKCKALVLLGKHSLAKTTYELFIKEYYKLYAEDYETDFQQTISW